MWEKFLNNLLVKELKSLQLNANKNATYENNRKQSKEYLEGNLWPSENLY